MDRIDILTGTFGKALGGGLGGYIASSAPVIEWLRQRARPYLFSNALPPMICAAACAAIDIAQDADDRRVRLDVLARRWREGLAELGFNLLAGSHPIVPVMLGEAGKAQALAAALDEEGVFVAGFFFPVVPQGMARIRTQMNAALTDDQLDQALDAFGRAGRKIGVIG